MIKKLLIITITSLGVLILPDWHPPYNYFESLLILVGFFGTFGPGLFLFMAILNRLVNLSMRFRD